jgi:acyl carrier protein
LSGRLSSVEAVEIGVFLEENFGVDFSEIGFDQARIDSVDLILSLAGQTKS